MQNPTAPPDRVAPPTNGHAVDHQQLQPGTEVQAQPLPAEQAPQAEQHHEVPKLKGKAKRLADLAADQQQLDALGLDVNQLTQPHPGRVQLMRQRWARARGQRAVARAQVQAEVSASAMQAEEIEQQAWTRRAQADADRATNVNARIATWAKKSDRARKILNTVMIAGVVWGSLNVRANIAGDLPLLDPRQLLGVVLEPMLMIPLLLNLSAMVEKFGGVHYLSGIWRKAVIGGLELGALSAIVWMNIYPHVHLPFGGLLIWLVPPLMVVASVLLKPQLANHYADLIEEARPAEAGQLDDEFVRVVEAAARIEIALTTGQLSAYDDDGLPSVTQARKYLEIGKADAQKAICLLRTRAHTLSNTSDQQ